MNSDKIILRLILATLVLLVCGEAYLFVTVQSAGGIAQKGAPIGTLDPAGIDPSNPPSASASALNTITVGDNPVAYIGTITAKQGNTIVAKTLDGVISFTTNSNTIFTVAGAQISDVTFQKNLEQYNSHISELMKDPIKNAAQLKALTPPSIYKQVSLTLSDFKAGDTVAITPADNQSGNNIQAVRVAKLAPGSAPQ